MLSTQACARFVRGRSTPGVRPILLSGGFWTVPCNSASIRRSVSSFCANVIFSNRFRALHCYLVDLCKNPVDRLSSRRRLRARRDGEARFAKRLRQLRPEIIVTVVRGIAENVERSQGLANWSGLHIKLPYPGRWHHHRKTFVQTLIPILRKNLDKLGH